MTEVQAAELRAVYFAAADRRIARREGAVLLDKLPLNIVWTHLIWRVFPDARFILALRHPVDACLGCFMQHFAVNAAMSSFLSRDGKTPVTLAPGVASAIAFQTQPLAVTIGVPPSTPDPAGGPEMLGTATPDTSITLQFNNLTPPGDPTALYFPCAYLPALPSLAPHIHVTTSLNGAAPTPVAAVITQNLMDTTQWVVAPPGTGADGTGGAWPDGATVTISVDSGAVDVFNQPLSPTAPASFIAASPVAGSTP